LEYRIWRTAQTAIAVPLLVLMLLKYFQTELQTQAIKLIRVLFKNLGTSLLTFDLLLKWRNIVYCKLKWKS